MPGCRSVHLLSVAELTPPGIDRDGDADGFEVSSVRWGSMSGRPSNTCLVAGHGQCEIEDCLLIDSSVGDVAPHTPGQHSREI